MATRIMVANPGGKPIRRGSKMKRRKRRRRKNPLYRNRKRKRLTRRKSRRMPGRKRKRLTRRKSRRYNYRPRRRNYRGASLAQNPVAALTKGFKLKNIGDAVPIVGGVIGNGFLASNVSNFLPSQLQTQPVRWGIGLATAGVTGLLVGFLPGMKKYQTNVTLGGLAYVLSDVANAYLAGPLQQALTGLGCPGCMGDYVTSNQAARARQIDNNLQGMGGMGDYVTSNQAAQARPIDNTLQGMASFDGINDMPET